MALQGLSEMAAQIYSRDFNMTVTISGPPTSDVMETFNITADNALILQSREVSQLFICLLLLENLSQNKSKRVLFN